MNKRFNKIILLVLTGFLVSGCASIKFTTPISNSFEIEENVLHVGDTLPSELPIASSVEIISKARNKADKVALFTDEFPEGEIEAVWLCRQADDASDFVIVDEMSLDESEQIPDGVWYVSEMENGETATYKILYLTAEEELVESNAVTICRLDRPTVVTEEGISHLAWEENPQADSYQVKYATKSDFSDAVVYTVKDCEHTDAFWNRLESDQEYWFRIRSYKVVDEETYYSSWSRACCRKR